MFWVILDSNSLPSGERNVENVVGGIFSMLTRPFNTLLRRVP